MTTPLTFTRAKAASRDLLCVSAIPDGSDFFEEPFTRLCRYDHSDPGSVKWIYDDVDVALRGIDTSCGHRASRFGEKFHFTLLSDEGDVVFMKPPIFPREKIAGAGISSLDSKHWGRMQTIRWIGDHFYACGNGGQVYKRSSGLSGEAAWDQLDQNLLRNPKSAGEVFEIYYCIDGPSEEEIYVCGSHGTILVWDGATFTRLPPITDATLVDIFVEDERSVWICGRDGTLLKGNRRNGFQPVDRSSDLQLLSSHVFLSVTKYEGKIYLASNANPCGLFVYQGDRLEQVSSGLKPDILDVHTVDSVDGVLWVVGSKDILRFDGKTWERIDHVDNKPIR